MIAEGAIAVVVLGALITSVEVRLRNKVGKDRFEDLKGQTERIERMVYQLVQERGITPAIDPPPEIKGGGIR